MSDTLETDTHITDTIGIYRQYFSKCRKYANAMANKKVDALESTSKLTHIHENILNPPCLPFFPPHIHALSLSLSSG